MKKDIHPEYYPDAVVRCACGNTWTTGSTVKEVRTDVCSACHPFFTGEQRIVDSEGRVDRFYRRLEQARQMQDSGETADAESSEEG
jgi:large subunit ribosomal protein L31